MSFLKPYTCLQICGVQLEHLKPNNVENMNWGIDILNNIIEHNSLVFDSNLWNHTIIRKQMNNDILLNGAITDIQCVI